MLYVVKSKRTGKIILTTSDANEAYDGLPSHCEVEVRDPTEDVDTVEDIE